MVQIKKAAVEDAIVESAGKLFRANGFSGTPMAAIARDAGVASSNIYVYFDSKMQLFYAVYEPWLRARTDEMLRDVRAQPNALAQIRCLLEWLWIDIPSADNYFSNNLMEALSTADKGERYTDACLLWFQGQIAMILREVSNGALAMGEAADLAFMMIMAFDGFSMQVRVSTTPSSRSVLDIFAQMLLTKLVLA